MSQKQEKKYRTKVSFVVPVYNEAQNPLIKDTFKSIVNQGLEDIELIVVDDGSSDDSVRLVNQIISELGIINFRLILNKKNLGIARSLNKGIKMAKGKYIARLDIGDIALPGRIAKQVEYLEKKPDIVLLGTLFYWINLKKKIIRGPSYFKKSPFIFGELKDNCFKHNYILHPTWLVRKSLFLKVGYYDPRCTHSEDFEFLIRVLKYGYKVEILPEFKTIILKNPEGLSGNLKVIQIERAKIKLRNLVYFFSFKNLFYTLKSLFGIFIPEFFLKLFSFLTKD